MREKYAALKLDFLNSKMSLRKFCKENKLDRILFSKYIKNEYEYHRRKPMFDDTLFEKIDNSEKAYWLGFLYADGCVTYNVVKKIYSTSISLAIKDYSHLEKLSVFLKHPGNIKIIKKTNACGLALGSKKISEDLIKLGCIPRKSLVLKFPNNNQLPKEFVNDFLRGYFDGDGCLSLSKNDVSFKLSILGTKEFLQEISNMYGGTPILKDKRHLHNTYYLRFRTKEALLFLSDIYKDSDIYLSRKLEKYLQLIDKRNKSKTINKIKNDI